MIGVYIAKKKVISAVAAMNRHDYKAVIADWSKNCVFVYPGNVPASGRIEGITEIEKWFKVFFEQFPGIEFTIKNICCENIFDFTGSNVLAMHWEIVLTNRDGNKFHNYGITLIIIKFGKVIYVQDFISDTGDVFRASWNLK